MRRRAIVISVFILLLGIGIGLFVYEFVTTRTISSNSILKGGIFIGSAVAFLVKGLYGLGGKIPYQKYESAYAKELERAFIGEGNKAERKELLNAIHLFNTKAYAGAISKLEKLLTKCQTGGDMYAVKLFMALSYEGTKSGYKAMEIYKEMIRQGTHRATPYINLGVLYDLDGNAIEAIKCFKEAVRLDPTDYHSYNNLAQVYTANDQFTEAIECAERALEIKSNFNDSLEVLALAYNAIGNYEMAEKYFVKSLKTGSSEQRLKHAMNVYKNTGLSEPQEEIEDDEI